jgi:hypothetical protein
MKKIRDEKFLIFSFKFSISKTAKIIYHRGVASNKFIAPDFNPALMDEICI